MSNEMASSEATSAPSPPPPSSSSSAATAATAMTTMAATLPRKHHHHHQQQQQQYHYGLVNVSDGKCRPQPARLKVCPDHLVLQREEFIFPDDDDGLDNKVRQVRLRRQSDDGSLGISIKGGRDHNLPILISKVCRSEDDDHVYIGDAIVKVNQTPLTSCSHEEALSVLRGAGGPEVALTVKHYRSAAPFLLKNLRMLIPEQQQQQQQQSASSSSTTAAEPEVDGNRNNSSFSSTCSSSSRKSSAAAAGGGIGASGGTAATTTTTTACVVPSSFSGPASSASASASLAPRGSAGCTPTIDSPSSMASDVSSCTTTWNGMIPRVRRKWVDVVEVPLMMAYVTRYIYGTDKIRPNAFEVRGLDGSNTGVIHSQDLAILSHWIRLISDYINALTAYKGSQFNREFSSAQQISYMGWVAEGVLNRNQPWQNWKPKFFALRGAEVCVAESPPLAASDWSAHPSWSSYKVYEAMFRVIKGSENVDERQHCFLIQTAGQESRYFSMETRAELLRLESAWHRAVCSTVAQMGSKTFHVVYRHLPAAFTIDWTDGFLLKPFASPNYHFIYSFSQLKSSSDDGSAKLTLLFQDVQGGAELVEQELICPKLQDLLFFMHAFLTAKVASLDPSFLSRGRIAS